MRKKENKGNLVWELRIMSKRRGKEGNEWDYGGGGEDFNQWYVCN